MNLFIPLEIPKSLTNSQLPYDGKREVWLTMFGFIGNYKGYQTAIEALHYLPENFRLLIIGGIHPRSRTEFALEKIMRFKATGHWQGDLKKSRPLQLANTSFEDRVIVTGYLKAEEVSSKMQQTDIFLAPYFEGGPSGSAAIAVGLKAGKPVIASKTRSFEEIQYQSQAMKMVTPGAPAEMAFVVQQLMENEAERIDLVDKILQFAKTRTWDDYVMRLGLKQHKN